MATCAQPGCRFNEDGTCLEGQGSKCPHLVHEEHPQEETVEVAPSEEGEAPDPEVDFEPLYSGKKLTPEEAASILRASPAQVISIAGAKDSGKTTLLARIHEYFHEGPFSGYSFSGSRTLMGFGLVSWNAMMASGRDKPDTERTKRWENDGFLHLRLRRHVSEPHVELLLNDISGESFSQAASHEPTCRLLSTIDRADHLVVLLDGGALADSAARHVQVRNARDFLKMAIQTGQVGKHTLVDLVISRVDLLSSADSNAEAYASRKQAEIRDEFEAMCGGIRLWHIAARPESGFEETKEQIGALFSSWLEDSVRLHVGWQSHVTIAPGARDFVRFGAVRGRVQ